MIADQEFDGPPRIGRQLEAVEHALRELHAFLRVLGLAPLADVVEEQRERQELGRVEFLQNRVEALLARIDGFHSDSTPRIASSVCSSTVHFQVEVADHATVNPRELRKHAVEQPAVGFGQAGIECLGAGRACCARAAGRHRWP